MSEFSNVFTGTDGFRLIELSTVMGKPLIFTKIEIGKGINTDGGGRTSLIEKTMECDITRVAEVENADVDEARTALYFAYSNEEVEEGYSMTEVGVWARVVSESFTDSGWGGYQGEELFFGYAYAEDAEKGSWIPDKSHKMDVQEYVIYASVGNATSVGVEIASSQYARLEDFTFHVNDANAHSNFKGCTETANGVRGFVPQPQAGDGEKFLSAKGGWEKAKMTTLELVNILYPKGIILPFADGTDPNEIWQGTTWKRTLQGRVAVGAGEYWENGKKFTYEVGDTGGEAEHKLTEREMAKITPKIASSTMTVSRVSQIHGVVTNYSSTNQYKDVPKDGWSGTVISGEETGGGTKDHGMEVRNVLETLSPSIAIASIGGDERHENRPPFQGVCYWVRTQ
ncbi:phage baseplate protein [Acidaminococcus intestini]|uniref:phage baseplate protein n=1 Tax=Acidaminococcus intestini TaxID=187327 RepID=UPI003AB7C0DC